MNWLLKPFFVDCIQMNKYLWWHSYAKRYKIAIMVIFENYRDYTNFPGDII